MYVSRVQYSCVIVLVFWFWQEISFGITYVLSIQYTCGVVSVFWLWRETVLWRDKVLKIRTPFDFLWADSTKISYWVTLLWSDSWCVSFVKPNTFLLCIFLFCIFLLSCTDLQVEVQIRILRSFESFRGVNPVGDDCMDLQPYSHIHISKILRTFFASRN